MANILLGSVPGVWIGAALITRVPTHGLRPALGCVLLGSALGVLSTGLAIPIAAMVAVPLAIGLLAGILHYYRVRLVSAGGPGDAA